MNKVHVKTGDTVVILSGKDRGKKGKVMAVSPSEGKVIVENANRLQVFMDVMDAWDFEDDYRDQPEVFMQLDSTKVRQFGDLTQIVQSYSFQNSRLVQTIFR